VLKAQRRSGDAPRQKHGAHADIDGLAPQMRQHARDGRGDDLVRAGGHGDGRRHADEEQERRDEEPSADAEQARHDAHKAAEAKQEEGIHRNLCDGQVKLHG
jgi:hypothetical protein